MNRIAAIIIGLAMALALAGCPAPVDPKPDDPVPEVPVVITAAIVRGDVYIAGDTAYLGSQFVACFWKNGVKTDVGKPGGNSFAHDVLATNVGEFVAGRDLDGSAVQHAALWHSGACKILDSADSWALSMALWKGKILVVGYCFQSVPVAMNVPCYWEYDNGTVKRHDLPADDFSGTAYDIAVSGNDVYICGGYDGKACYWKNGAKTDLPGGKYAYAIDHYDGKLYTGGISAGGGACYWIDSAQTILTGFPGGAGATSKVIALDAGPNGLCMGGNYQTSTTGPFGFAWKDGTLTSPLDMSSIVAGMGQYGTDVFMAVDIGWYKNDSYTALPPIANHSLTVFGMEIF